MFKFLFGHKHNFDWDVFIVDIRQGTWGTSGEVESRCSCGATKTRPMTTAELLEWKRSHSPYSEPPHVWIIGWGRQ